MEKEQLQKNETEEMVSSYKQQISDKKKEFKSEDGSVVISEESIDVWRGN